MERDIGPRVLGRGMRGERGSNAQVRDMGDDVDINAYIERTPKTNEQINRENSSAGWEYNFWVIVIIGIVILLLVLVIWFMFKKDDTVELQRQLHPHPGGQYMQRPLNQNQQNVNQQPAQFAGQQAESNKDDGMAADVRANLSKKSSGVRRSIGPVPGECLDNPAVVGIVTNPPSEQSPQVQQEVVTQPATQPGAPAQPQYHTETNEQNCLLPDIQVPLVTDRLISNLGLVN